MRGVVHRRQARPVVGPAVHVLLVRAAQELDPSQLALVVQFLDEEVLAAVDDGFHHHEDLAARPLGLDEPLAVFDAGGHRHGAGDVLAGLEGGEALGGVVGDRRVDVNGVDVGVGEELVVVGVADFDAETVAALLQPLFGAATDGGHLRVGVVLVDRDELGAEAEADDGDADLLVGGHATSSSGCGFGMPVRICVGEGDCKSPWWGDRSAGVGVSKLGGIFVPKSETRRFGEKSACPVRRGG